ncbi:hypothetical protein PCHCB_000498200 [Plasmodium chabaudi chabaudi]|uniref:Uncharacterized protein n=2 Tax=Plasmodium chabaudi TaxID=5825 RepID=A0A1C6W9U5_PLACU|nr:hypothetical protein PCHAJ_000491600 [Plasmodium chabaudi chabaudi]SCL83214.1 hypothetical protein PCHCB_000498200 [Plasmodium chabaudi chabaudi]SCL83584.1 hypothetical protein PCHDS_000496000 [Plasmodium chabaudi adami]
MIGRADIEGSKSYVARSAWQPQASYPCDVPPQSNSPPGYVSIVRENNESRKAPLNSNNIRYIKHQKPKFLACINIFPYKQISKTTLKVVVFH